MWLYCLSLALLDESPVVVAIGRDSERTRISAVLVWRKSLSVSKSKA
jgi:hypothetical protein